MIFDVDVILKAFLLFLFIFNQDCYRLAIMNFK